MPLFAPDEERAGRARAFLRHLGTFAWVMLVLAVIDVLDGTHAWFIHWVAAVWGAVLAVHLADAFVLRGFLGFHALGCGPCFRSDRDERSRAPTP